jgi:hypothetical protein
MHDDTLSLGALLSQPAWTIGAIWQYTGPIASGSDYVQGPQITGATGQGGTPALGIFARAGADGTTLHAYGQLVVMAGTFYQDIDIAGAAHTSHYSVQWFDGTKIRYQVDGGPMDDSTPPAGAFDPTSYTDWGVGMGDPLGSNSAWVGSIALVITYNTTLPATLNSWLKSHGGF